MEPPAEDNLPESELTRPSFDSFISMYASENGWTAETIDAENRFAILRGNTGSLFQRTYFAEDLSGGFSSVASSSFLWGINLEKIGRKIDKFHREKEELRMMRDEEANYGTTYSLEYLKGQRDFDKANSVHVRFDDEDNLESFGFEQSDGSTISSRSIQASVLLDHFTQSNDPYVSDGGRIIVENATDSYTFYLIGEDGEPHHRAIVSRKIDSESLYYDWGIGKLLKNPLQPANGIPGKSYGDSVWKRDNFSNRLGISVVPIDEQGVEDFDSKGFREFLKGLPLDE